ncbi:hypothetical protein OPQ81_000424 [Rhizoctonia solani]|nr:hypothetical protein OPQ81_000424 [Rhizoctonia solani]
MGYMPLQSHALSARVKKKEAQISDAYDHMLEAGKLEEDSPIVKSAYMMAAQKMIACIELRTSHSTATLWYHAATCFEKAKEITSASEAYSKGGFYDRALLVFFEAQNMTGCLDVILSYSQEIDEALLQHIKEFVSIHFLHQQDYGCLKRLLNGNIEECIELAKSHRLRTQLKHLLGMAQRFEDLATEHLNDDLPTDAVRCLVHHLKTPSAIQQSRNIISVFLWTNFGLSPTISTQSKEQADQLIELWNSQCCLLDPEGLQDSRIFEAIISQEQLSPVTFYNLLGSLNPESAAYISRVTVLQYHALKENHWASCLSYDDFSTYIEIWSAYSTGLHRLKTLEYPSQDIGIRRLLGLSSPSTTSTSEVIVPNRSPLRELIPKPQMGSGFRGDCLRSGISVHPSDADVHIQALFANRTKKGTQ